MLHELLADLPHSDAVIFFYGSILSQWAESPFTRDGVRYNTAEQYMMARKARLFDDQDALKAIMATPNPSQQKAIGRRVRNFSKERWERFARIYVTEANQAKFGQNPVLLEALLSTDQRLIVEASPTDCIWGIGLGIDDPRIFDLRSWRGSNWLGLVLMDVREYLRNTRTPLSP